MLRIPLVEPSSEPDELRPVFQQLRETRGRVPGMYRVLAHRPEILSAHRAYFHATLDTGALSRSFKEKVAYKVARACGSEYSTSSHRTYALKHGVTMDELTAIEGSDYFSLLPKEEAGLKFADEMLRTDGHVHNAAFDDLRRHYSLPEIVELVALVGIMQLASTFSAVFGLEPD